MPYMQGKGKVMSENPINPAANDPDNFYRLSNYQLCSLYCDFYEWLNHPVTAPEGAVKLDYEQKLLRIMNALAMRHTAFSHAVLAVGNDGGNEAERLMAFTILQDQMKPFMATLTPDAIELVNEGKLYRMVVAGLVERSTLGEREHDSDM
jgi:hypothetical protein